MFWYTANASIETYGGMIGWVDGAVGYVAIRDGCFVCCVCVCLRLTSAMQSFHSNPMKIVSRCFIFTSKGANWDVLI